MKRWLILGASGSGLTTWAQKLFDAIPHAAFLSQDPTTHLTYLRDTVIEEVVFGLEQRGIAPETMLTTATDALQQVNLADLAECHPTQLSGGQTRRVALASVIALGAGTFILDDPWAGLDAESARQLLTIVANYPGDVIIVAHTKPPVAHDFTCFDLVEGELVPHVAHPHALPKLAPLGEQEQQVIDLGEVVGCRQQPPRRWWQFFRQPAVREFATKPVLLQPARGEVLWLQGANGSGKTTLFRTLVGFSGDVGQRDASISISMQTQRAYDQVTETTVRDFIGGKLEGLDPDAHPLDLPAAQLRLAQVAKVLYLGVDVVLLDEPDVGLDYIGRTQFHRLLHRHLGQHTPPAIIMTCHDATVMAEVSQYATVRELSLDA